MTDRIKIKYWWSDDKKWFCILSDDGNHQTTISLTVEEAGLLSMNAAPPEADAELTPCRSPDVHGWRPDGATDGLIHGNYPLPIEHYERVARNLAAVWSNGSGGARMCILAALLRAAAGRWGHE